MGDMNAAVTDADNGTVGSHNESNAFILGLNCPEISDDDTKLMDDMAYWLEGILQTVVAFGGIFGNVASCYILSRREMRNSFNLLLVMLSVYDTFYLLFAVLDSCRKFFESMGLVSEAHIILFPHLLYPLHHTSLAGSIFMTVSIAFERYTAVHYPLDYNQSVSTPQAMRRRLLKYFIPVLVMSLAFNIPKWFECYVDWELLSNTTIVHQFNHTANQTSFEIEWKPYLQITDMRVNEYYSIYNTYSRVFALGLIPLALISFFNYKIFKDIRERQMRKANAGKSLPTSTRKANVPSKNLVTSQTGETTTTRAAVEKNNCHIDNPSSCGSRMEKNATGAMSKTESYADKDGEAIPMLHNTNIHEENSGLISENMKPVGPFQNDAHHTKQIDNERIDVSEELEKKKFALSNTNQTTPIISDTNHSEKGDVISEKNKGWTKYKKKMTLKKSVKAIKENTQGKPKKNEDNLGVVFMGIISIFIVTNLPRVLLDINEAAYIRKAQLCGDAGKNQFPLWSMLCLSVAHFLLVLGSSMNVVIYSLTSSQFRAELLKVFDSLAYRLGCRKRRRHGLGIRNGQK